MKLFSKRIKLALVTMTIATLPVCAQDNIKIKFSQTSIDKDKKYHTLRVNFNYLSECADLEKACAKFFFNDSVSPSLETAVKNYQSQYPAATVYVSQPDYVQRFSFFAISSSPGKYTNYEMKKYNEENDGITLKTRTLIWNVVYDTQHDRLLTVDDIFVPQEAVKIKEKIGNRRQQLLVSEEGVVWGYMQKGRLNQNRCYYRQNPFIFNEEFRKLIGGSAFNHGPIFASGSTPKDFLRENIKYPEPALKNLEMGSVTVTFKIDADGSVKDARVLNDENPNLSGEVLRVINSMPRWIPAVWNGENVLSDEQTLSVHFPTEPADNAPMIDYLMKNLNSATVNALTKQTKIKSYEILSVIEADGTVSSVKVKDNSSPLLVKVLNRLLKGMPKCTPAKMYDVAVRSQKSTPIEFSCKDNQVEIKAKSTVAFTVPEIKKDTEVMPEKEIMSVNGRVDRKGAFEVEGQPSPGVVLKAKEVILQPSSSDNGYDGDTKVFDVVEQMPSFPGGQAALFQWLSNNIKYPVVAEKNGVQGRVIVTFVVERDGSITDVRVVKSVDPSLDKEAVRVTKAMPHWIPGKQKGDAVRVKYTMPVTFRLQ